MSYVKIWVHLVFSTKNHEPLMFKETRTSIFNHILENARKKKIWIDHVGGHSDHIHCLISLGKDQSISNVSQLIKGESSFWINKNRLIRNFSWQDDYFAVSISESQVHKVRKYIQSQEQHHKKKTFDEEVKEFLEKYGWEKINSF
jgi:putative transposase